MGCYYDAKVYSLQVGVGSAHFFLTNVTGGSEVQKIQIVSCQSNFSVTCSWIIQDVLFFKMIVSVSLSATIPCLTLQRLCLVLDKDYIGQNVDRETLLVD